MLSEAGYLNRSDCGLKLGIYSSLKKRKVEWKYLADKNVN